MEGKKKTTEHPSGSEERLEKMSRGSFIYIILYGLRLWLRITFFFSVTN